NRIVHMFDTLALKRELAPQRQSAGGPVRVMPCGAHHIAYRVEYEDVAILRVLHHLQGSPDGIQIGSPSHGVDAFCSVATTAGSAHGRDPWAGVGAARAGWSGIGAPGSSPGGSPVALAPPRCHPRENGDLCLVTTRVTEVPTFVGMTR